MEGEHVDRTEEVVAVETDRGLFDHSKGKKEEEKKTKEEKLYAADLEKVTLADEFKKANRAEEKAEVEEKHDRVMEEIRGSDHNSSCDGEEAGDKPEEAANPVFHHEPVHVPVVHHEPVPVSVVHHEPVPSEEKKGIMDKIKDKVSPPPTNVAAPPPVEPEEPKNLMEKIKYKLPGEKKPEEAAAPPHVAAPPPEVVAVEHGGDVEPKKGIMDKIKEKLPGHHPKGSEEVNIKE